MSSFFTHIIYSRPAYNEEGRAYLAHDTREDAPGAYAEMPRKLVEVAENVKFTSIPSAIMPTDHAHCDEGLGILTKEMEGILGRSSKDEDLFWFNPWNRNARQPGFPASLRLRHHFLLAKMLVHEVTHAYFMLWQKDACLVDEPRKDHDDVLAEAGCAWEEFAFGRSFQGYVRGPLYFLD
ncbi:hypothetical protein EJ02DRAFT_425887 [Clathrospora elynae]|uniref:Uncharacterized protein n=1 Tax=Clathrospora elynae TaxID=706981 RepID=A0A6A5SLI7_9PLEO|nr:hypothetical protein EJ02DRAFT_425887 [Clathrospora elynae]